VADLTRTIISHLSPDTLRQGIGFSQDIIDAHRILFDQTIDEESKIECLNNWIQKFQPCLFGTMAAGPSNLIGYCILDHADLDRTDEEIADIIQDARNEWKLEAFDGSKSAFIILLLSQRIAEANPDQTLLELALHICSMYLSEQKRVEVDERRQDEMLLRFSTTKKAQWFVAGVDYFSTQGDRRWWHDHRFPGGMAFVVNSPGHLALAELQRRTLEQSATEVLREEIKQLVTSKHIPKKGQRREVEKQLKAALARLKKTKVDSLPSILKYAMHTIMNATDQSDPAKGPTWPKATSLLRRDPELDACPYREIEEDGRLKDKDYRFYIGWYHTDHTIRSDFFSESQSRPELLDVPFALDLSYLTDPATGDFQSIAKGVTIKLPQLKLPPIVKPS
jgi:hypothetical protein